MNITKQIAQLTRQGKYRPRTVSSLRRNQLRRLLLESLETRQLLAADNPLLLSSARKLTAIMNCSSMATGSVIAMATLT